MLLDREEYVEQAYFFRTLCERMQMDMSTQDLLVAIRQEILATTKLPMALEFMLQELRHTGGFATAMAHIPHYFTPFQTFVVAEAETEGGRLLGAQAVGGHGVVSRINALATALTGGLSVEELAYLDLAYAPPFSGAWDPVHIAAQQLLK